MNKQGQGAGLLGFLVIGIAAVFVLYLIAVPMAKVWDDISTEYKQPDVFGEDNKTVENIEKIDNFVTPAFDQFIFIALIGIMLALIIVAVFSDVHPVFIIFLIIGIIIIVIAASQLVNVTEDAFTGTDFEAKQNEFQLSNLVMGASLPVIILVVGAVAVAIMARRGGGGGA